MPSAATGGGVDDPARIRLWDDNPTSVDMLGFDAVVDTVIAAVTSPDLDPVTVALQSSWGGGKSTALGLIAAKLASEPDIVVVRCDPWEYDDLPKSEVRALVIGQVLEQLRGRPGFVERAAGVLRRIAWVKVGATITNMVLARTVDVEKLTDAFTPGAERPTSMAGFREEFAKLMLETADVRKVIVLVDDLDRCSPDSVVAILESIKVFLSVKKMAFVLAAEEALIRFAIERSANAGTRSTYSDRYLEKIVQLPVRLPMLSQEEAETFVALLLAQQRHADAGAGLISHVQDRRRRGTKPYLVGPYAAGVAAPDGEDLALAALVAQGVSHDKWTSPRAIKRFLNACGVRVEIARKRGADLDLAVMLKLYILEDRFPKSFEALVSRAPDERGALLDEWEAWATSAGVATPPEGIEGTTRDWASSPPELKSVSGRIDAYLTVAATFTSVSAGEGLPTEVLALLDDLLSSTDTLRRAAVIDVNALDLDTRGAVVVRLTQRAGSGAVTAAIESAAAIASSDPSLAPVFHEAVRAHALPYVTEPAVVDIATVAGAEDTLAALLARAGLDGSLKTVVERELADLKDS